MGRKAPKVDAAAGTAADGEPALTEAEKSSPVMRAVGKRVRAYRKKLNRIAAFEQMRQDGKELNSDQEETVRQKAGVLAVIEELGKLEPLMAEAAVEEVATAKEKEAERERLRAERRAQKEAEAAEKQAMEDGKENLDDDGQPRGTLPPSEPAVSPEAASNEPGAAGSVDAAVSRLVDLLYFSQLFDPDAIHNQAERSACITYDFTSTAEGEALTEAELTAIPAFGKLLVSRAGRPLSHAKTLDECKRLAGLWLNSPDAQLPDSNFTVATLAARLQRVLSSQYMVTEPQIKQPEDLAPLEPTTEQHSMADGQLPAAPAPQEAPMEHSNYSQQPAQDGDWSSGALAVSQAESVLQPPVGSGSGGGLPHGAHHVSTLEMQMGIHHPHGMPREREDARLPEVLSMGTLNSGYTGQHSDAASLSMMPQQQQPAPQGALSGGLDAQRAGSGYASFMAGPLQHQSQQLPQQQHQQQQQHRGFGQEYGSAPPPANNFQPQGQFNFMTDSSIEMRDRVASGGLDGGGSAASFGAPIAPPEPHKLGGDHLGQDAGGVGSADVQQSVAPPVEGTTLGVLATEPTPAPIANGIHGGDAPPPQQNGVQGGGGGRGGGYMDRGGRRGDGRRGRWSHQRRPFNVGDVQGERGGPPPTNAGGGGYGGRGDGPYGGRRGGYGGRGDGPPRGGDGPPGDYKGGRGPRGRGYRGRGRGEGFQQGPASEAPAQTIAQHVQ